MFCILAFVVLLILFPILGFFPGYRQWFKKAWGCVFKRVTLQPCDVNIWEEMKSKLLSRAAFRFPRATRFFDRTFTLWAILFVLLNIWAAWSTLNAGLNLWVYGTCNAASGESCSLSGEACGVARYQLSLRDALRQGTVGEWIIQPFAQVAETVSLIPNRVRVWHAADYLGPTATFYYPYDPKKPVALEILDPGCKYCKQLFHNIKDAGLERRYNLSYLVYPIPDKTTPTGYKFAASETIARYLEAVKKVPRTSAEGVSADWQLIEWIFGAGDTPANDRQNQFNMLYTQDEIPGRIEDFLLQIGYTSEQVATIRTIAASSEVASALQIERDMVEHTIKTIRIPTFLFQDRRYDRVVNLDELQ